jgi:bifunctional non-homologous end joining protein LigD
MSRLSFIEPQLASPVDQPPEGKHWIHEIKPDGYRCQVVIEQGHTRVFAGNGYNWSDRYPSIIQAAADLRCQSAIIDGEAILPDGNGVADFDSLKSAMRWRPASIILYAFDLMHLDGADLRRESLTLRRSILRALIGRNEENRIQFSEEFVGDGAVLFKACVEHGLEGIISKQALSPYPSGRSKTWLRCKCFTESTFCRGRD